MSLPSVARPAHGLPERVHCWTLVDAGPLRIAGKRPLQVKVKCDCGVHRLKPHSEWARGQVPKWCERCDRKRKRTKGAAAYTPYKSAIVPFHKMRGR